MKYVVYIDVFFAVNLIMDFLILRIAAYYIKPQTTLIRCLLGGGVGSGISCISIVLSYEYMILHMLLSYIITVYAMVLVAYGRCRLRQMVKRCVWLYFVTVFIGGAMNLIYNYTYFGYMVHGIINGIYKNPVNLLYICLCTGVSYIVLSVIFSFIKSNGEYKHLVYVNVSLKGKKLRVKGLIDSGNSLKEPYGGKPVHIIEYRVLKEILEGVDIHEEKYRIVPFNSLGKKNGIIEVIDCDEIVVYEEEEEGRDKEHIYMEKGAAMGIYYGTLSSDGKFEMLLHKSVGY